MKKTLLLTAFFGLFCMTLQASFPVNKTNVEKAGAEIETLVELDAYSDMAPANMEVTAETALSPAAAAGDTKLIVTLLLWFFLGGLAAHRWYAKKPALWNIIFIITLGGLGIWWLVDLVSIVSDKF